MESNSSPLSDIMMTPNNTEGLVSVENQNPRSKRQLIAFLPKYFKANYPSDFLKKILSEIIATYLLVFVTCGAAAISASDQNRISRLGASVAGGLIVTVMIYAVGHISGAHMNPAVTTAFATVRHFPWNQVPLYAAAQLTGSTLASFTLRVLLHPIKRLGTTSPSGTDLQALIMEIVVTFSMMFVTLAVATDSKAIGELAGLAVGSAVCITSILAGPVSGGSMNPVRTLGPAIASNYFKGLWVYFVGPFCGTLLGAWAYSYIRGVSGKPVHALTPKPSFSVKLRKKKSINIVREHNIMEQTAHGSNDNDNRV